MSTSCCILHCKELMAHLFCSAFFPSLLHGLTHKNHTQGGKRKINIAKQGLMDILLLLTYIACLCVSVCRHFTICCIFTAAEQIYQRSHGDICCLSASRDRRKIHVCNWRRNTRLKCKGWCFRIAGLSALNAAFIAWRNGAAKEVVLIVQQL